MQLLERVRRQRVKRHVLPLRQHRRVAVHRRRPGEHQPAYTRVARGHEQVERGVHVGPMAEHRFGDRSRHRRDGRLVQHVVHAGRRRVRDVRLGQVALDELDPAGHRREILPVPRDEAVDHADALAPANQFLHQMRTDEPRAAGHQIMSPSSALTKADRLHGPFAVHAGREAVPCRSAAASRKPNPVSPPSRLAALRRGDDHSSGPVITGGI